VAEGTFRADLFFRLNVVRLEVPPLRARREDVPLLVGHFLARFNQEMDRAVTAVAPEAMELLCAYGWPGNVRELKNALERAFILYGDVRELRPEHLPPSLREPALAAAHEIGGDEPLQLKGAERRLLEKAMERAGGNQSQAAKILGVSRDTLRYRLKKHGML
jgi:DNA-binding NtrC family response regulator